MNEEASKKVNELITALCDQAMARIKQSACPVEQTEAIARLLESVASADIERPGVVVGFIQPTYEVIEE